MSPRRCQASTTACAQGQVCSIFRIPPGDEAQAVWPAVPAPQPGQLGDLGDRVEGPVLLDGQGPGVLGQIREQFDLPQVTCAERDPDYQGDHRVRPNQHPRAAGERPAQASDEPDPIGCTVQQHRTGVPDHPPARNFFQPAGPTHYAFSPGRYLDPPAYSVVNKLIIAGGGHFPIAPR